MTSTLERAGTSTGTPARRTRDRAYEALLGLTALAVLLQALWAGIFMRNGDDHSYDDSWVEVHARGADVAILLAAVATVVAFVRLRQRRELWIGTGVLTLLLVLEAYIGGLVSDENKSLSIIHLPIAMALMVLVVWLPVQAIRPRGGQPTA